MRSLTTSVILAALIITSCSEDNYLPDLEGNMVGYAFTFNEFGELLSDHSGISVSTEGRKVYKATTDSKGRFEIKKVPIGTYTLNVLKPGFGALKYYGVRHLGGTPTIIGYRGDNTTMYGFFIYEFPKTSITDLKVVNDSLYVKFDMTDREPYWMRLRLYFSESSGFNADEAPTVINRSLRQVNEWYGCLLKGTDLQKYTPGTKLYFRAKYYPSQSGIDLYNLDVYGISTWFDHELNQTVYPCLGDATQEYSYIIQ